MNDPRKQALTLHQQGQLRDALNLYEVLLRAQPDDLELLRWSAIALTQFGYPAQALPRLQKASQLAPRAAALHNDLAVCLSALNRRTEALDHLQQACQIEPASLELQVNRLSMTRALLGPEAALQALQPLLAQADAPAALWREQGLALAEADRHADAIPALEQALARQPKDLMALLQLALSQQNQERDDEALQTYDTLLRLQPAHADSHNNRAALWRRRGDLEQALAGFREALRLQPEHAEALHNLGSVLSELHRPEEALQAFRAALARHPNYPLLAGRTQFAALQIADWSDWAQGRDAIRAGLEQGHYVCPPFASLALVDDPVLQRRAAELQVQHRVPAAAPALPVRAPGQRLRIGYFSADFHNHATAHLAAGLFEQHDRERFEVRAYCFGPKVGDDKVRERLVKSFDGFHEVGPLKAAEIAALAREHGLDIAIDLKGHTRDARPAIFAARAAPLQISYLGYPGALGMPFIDYLVADPVLVPAGQEAAYGESLILMPECYQVNDDRRKLAAKTAARADHGLPEAGFVFCCFNALYKINPEQFASWMRILQRVPDSVLWLLEGPSGSAERLRAQAQAQGIDPQRLHFAPALSPQEHLDRHAAADLFLDTLPCNAHTTASDALWAGLPLITQIGRSWAARVAASLLTTHGLEELVCADAQAYEDLAVALAQDPKRLKALRTRVGKQRKASPLFDTARFTRHFEQGLLLAHERLQQGQTPTTLRVPQQPEVQTLK